VEAETAGGALLIPNPTPAAAADDDDDDAAAAVAAAAFVSTSFALALKGGSGELLFNPLSVSGSFFRFAILLVLLLPTPCFMSRASRSM
jgi:hypothetical protein